MAAGSGTCSSISMQVTASKPCGCSRASVLGRGHAVVDREALLRGMQARHLDHARCQVDAGDPRPGAAQGLGEQAAAAADVEQSAAGQRARARR